VCVCVCVCVEVVGQEREERSEFVVISRVLQGSPAAQAGVRMVCPSLLLSAVMSLWCRVTSLQG
jgi:hypothetical protein